MRFLGKNKWLVVIACISIVPLLPLFFGYFPAIGDMRDVFIPLESFFHTEQLRGSIPVWNQYISFGFPVIAAAQIGFFYPVLFILRFLPIYLELPIALIFHVALCAIGSFLFARRLGLSKQASVITALSFSLSQFVWQHLTHLNIFLAIAWLPWQMLAVDTVFKKEKLDKRGIITLIALFSIPFLIGQIQTPFLMMVFALAYGVWIYYGQPRLTPTPRLKAGDSPLSKGEKFVDFLPSYEGRRGGVVWPLVIIIFGTIAFSSVQLFPTLELVQLSSRGAAGGFDIARANQHSYPLYHLPAFLFPRFYGNDNTYWGKRLEIEYGTYIGVIPLLLAIWYISTVIPDLLRPAKLASEVGIRNLRRGSRLTGRDDNAFFFWALTIFFLLSLGSLSPFRLIGLEPSLWIFSAPARWLLLTTFSLSLFAGFGFDALEKNKASARKFVRISAISIFSLVILANIVLFSSRSTPLSPKITSMLASALTSSISLASPYTYLTIASLCILVFALSYKKYKKILLIATVIDLVIIAGTTTPMVSWSRILSVPTTISSLPDLVKNNMTRVYPMLDGGDTGAYFTDPSSRADNAKRNMQKNALVPLVSFQFGMSGISWPASLDIAEQEQYLSQLHPNNSYVIENNQLAKDLTIGAVLTTDKNNQVTVTALDAKQRLEIVCDESPTPSNSPSGRGRERDPSPSQGEAGWGSNVNCGASIQIMSDKPSELILKTKSEQNTTLIVRDTFYPGWHAYVDGIETSITKSPLFFRSIVVPAGEHIVTMKYIPRMLYIGGVISLLTLAICAIIVQRSRI